MRTSSKSR